MNSFSLRDPAVFCTCSNAGSYQMIFWSGFFFCSAVEEQIKKISVLGTFELFINDFISYNS